MDTKSSDPKQKPDPEDSTTVEMPENRSSVPEPPKGSLIAGRYEVLSQLGEGGMGVVFKVRDHKMGRRLIALKRIRQLDDRAPGRFESEIHSAANLNHRNICKVHDSGEAPASRPPGRLWSLPITASASPPTGAPTPTAALQPSSGWCRCCGWNLAEKRKPHRGPARATSLAGRRPGPGVGLAVR